MQPSSNFILRNTSLLLKLGFFVEIQFLVTLFSLFLLDVLNCEIFGKGYFEEGENKTPKNGFCSECKKEAYPIYT